MRQCPYCGEQIDKVASKCVFCGSTVTPEKSVAAVEANNTDEENISQTYTQNVSNEFKVFITMIATIPFIGHLIGIILGIVYMNSEDNPDKKSFGISLLTGTLIITAFTLLCSIVLIILLVFNSKVI
ncbi:MAG: hypothetical protein AB7G87_03270 [Clostridia bacterium]